MPSHRLPLVIPLARPWPQRLREALLTAWRGWRDRARLAREARLACQLSAHTLDDVGAPDEWRAAAEYCLARERMERTLLHIGIVPVGRW